MLKVPLLIRFKVFGYFKCFDFSINSWSYLLINYVFPTFLLLPIFDTPKINPEFQEPENITAQIIDPKISFAQISEAKK